MNLFAQQPAHRAYQTTVLIINLLYKKKDEKKKKTPNPTNQSYFSYFN